MNLSKHLKRRKKEGVAKGIEIHFATPSLETTASEPYMAFLHHIQRA